MPADARATGSAAKHRTLYGHTGNARSYAIGTNLVEAEFLESPSDRNPVSKVSQATTWQRGEINVALPIETVVNQCRGLVKVGLYPFVERQMRTRYGNGWERHASCRSIAGRP